MLSILNYWWTSFLDLFFPKICLACEANLSEQEGLLCIKCEYHLPLTHYCDYKDNPVEKMFWGRVPIRAAGSLYFYNKGSGVQKMMHQLKYKRRKDIGIWMGNELGKKLKLSHRFDNIDFVVPVPLHPKKEFKRGYNQSVLIAMGIEEETGWKYEGLLNRKKNNPSQTRKSKYDRWLNVSSSFQSDEKIEVEGKNILLVDDVITTGATLEANVLSLLKSGANSVCVATVASA